jgi:hypothetical protein
LNPKEIDTGVHWVTLRLKNIGDETVNSLDVKLHSLDTHCISILGTGEFIDKLEAGQEATRAFQLSADATTEVYASVSGFKDEERFSVDSPWAKIKVGEEVAELESVFALTEPYASMGKLIKCEARIRGLENSEGLDLEFWAHTPSGKVEELARIETKELSAGQEARYTAEITPENIGFYTIHAYLYDGSRRIGHKTDTIWVEEFHDLL